MINYGMTGKVTRSEWLSGPKTQQKVKPIEPEDPVTVSLNYNCSGSQPSGIVESIDYSVTIGDIVWKSDGFLRTPSSSSGADRWMDGNFPNINLKQLDFINPLQHITGNEYAQINDISTISISLRGSGQESIGLIESSGYIISSGAEDVSSFVIEYKFDSGIVSGPIINNIVIK